MSRWLGGAVSLLLGLLLLSPTPTSLAEWSARRQLEASTSSAGSLPAFSLRCKEEVGLLRTSAVITWTPITHPAELVYSATVIDGPTAPTPSAGSVTIEPTLLAALVGKTRTVSVVGTLPRSPGSSQLTSWTTSAQTKVFYGVLGSSVTCA